MAGYGTSMSIANGVLPVPIRSRLRAGASPDSMRGHSPPMRSCLRRRHFRLHDNERAHRNRRRTKFGHHQAQFDPTAIAGRLWQRRSPFASGAAHRGMVIHFSGTTTRSRASNSRSRGDARLRVPAVARTRHQTQRSPQSRALQCRVRKTGSKTLFPADDSFTFCIGPGSRCRTGCGSLQPRLQFCGS